MNAGIYDDIARRTGSDIYAGVVGPVRTGKSTFIKRFMDILVIPNIENQFKKERAIDELPQSGSGRTIMTCEPKFVPAEAVNIKVAGGASMNVRMIDCVGYVVDDALGVDDGEKPRLIQTPWSDDPMPFPKAAEIGTRKVITEHSTIGIVVTTDGSITEIPRHSYIDAEERVITELKELGKPFVVVLNSTHPNAEATQKLQQELKEKYTAPVTAVNVAEMQLMDVENILTDVLYEFPVKQITYKIPLWIGSLERDHWLNTQIFDFMQGVSSPQDKIADVQAGITGNICENFKPVIDDIDLSTGTVLTTIDIENSVFYRIMSEMNGIELKNENDLFCLLAELMDTKSKYDRIDSALSAALSTGYGVVPPCFEDYSLEEPQIISQSSRYGVKITASAPSLHIISADVSTEVSPIIGSEAECEVFFNQMLDQYKNDQDKIWATEIFGRSLQNMIGDNLQSKVVSINEDTKVKLKKTLTRVVNSQKGGILILWL